MPRERLFRVTIDDCDVQTFRAGGNGGQAQNKTDSGVRIIHRASGARGEARDTRSQLQNKRAAFKRMAESSAFQTWARAEAQRLMGGAAVAPASTKERIRTYNLIERRVTDHRVPFTVHNVDAVLNGELDELHAAVIRPHA